MTPLIDLLNDRDHVVYGDHVVVVVGVGMRDEKLGAVLRIDNCTGEAEAAWLAQQMRPNVAETFRTYTQGELPDDNLRAYPLQSPEGSWSAVCLVGVFDTVREMMSAANVLSIYAATGAVNELSPAEIVT